MASKLAVTLLAFLMILSAVGCGGKEEAAETEAYTFTDALGRRVTVPRSPERVAALLGSFADVWVLAGGSLCAAPEDAWEDFGLELPDAALLGGAHSPDFETLIGANPDFVIASASTASNVDMKDSLESMGIPVAYFDVDSFEDYLSMLCICTEITGREDLYEKNGLLVREGIDSVKEKVSRGGLSQKECRILLLRVSSGSVKAKGSHGTILGEMLADLGCVNIADSDSTLLENLSVESVIRQEPHRIFAVTMGDDVDKASANLRQMLEKDPAWASLEAVKNDRVHIMDKKLFNIKPNDRWAESYEILSEILLSGEED